MWKLRRGYKGLLDGDPGNSIDEVGLGIAMGPVVDWDCVRAAQVAVKRIRVRDPVDPAVSFPGMFMNANRSDGLKGQVVEQIVKDFRSELDILSKVSAGRLDACLSKQTLLEDD